MIRGWVLLWAMALLVATAAVAHAQGPAAPSVGRQSLDDAWWTGPMLAPSAATLPRGHFLIEPYVFDVAVRGRYDDEGVRRTTRHTDNFGSLTYVLYGLADRLTVGLIPVAGYTKVSNGLSSSGIALGDVTVHAHYGLTKFQVGRRVPSIAIVIEQTLPTGKHDRLGDRPSDGLGSGAYTTAVAVYSQTYFWLPSGRILRMRFNVSDAHSSEVNLRDVSVYGTEEGFRGSARPGNSLFLNAAWEYSMTRKWVLALDATYRHDANTRVIGVLPLAQGAGRPQDASSVRLDSGSSEAFGLAPAIEFSWTPRVGILVGVRIIPAGRRTSASISPAVAINFVR